MFSQYKRFIEKHVRINFIEWGIVKSCFEAGVQVIKESRIDFKYMSDVSNPRVTSKTFQHQADSFWATLDGKKSYLREMVKLH